jgi:hypothetical protein
MISSSNSINEFINKEKQKIEEKEKIAEKLSREIEKTIKQNKIQPTSQLFQGILGVKHLMQDTLVDNKDYIVFGSPEKSVSIMGETFWRNYEIKRIGQGMKVKMLFNEDLRAFGRTIPAKNTEIKYLPKKFDGLIETIVYGNKVAIIVWTEKPTITLINDEHVANEYRKYFEIIWKNAKV